MMTSFIEAIDFFEGAAELLKSAETRMICAGAVAVLRGGEADAIA